MIHIFMGHDGATGYLAVLKLFGFTPHNMEQSALILNILVPVIALWVIWDGRLF